MTGMTTLCIGGMTENKNAAIAALRTPRIIPGAEYAVKTD
jgi:hypothetical protein